MRLMITRPMPPAVLEEAERRFDVSLPADDRPLSVAEAAQALAEHDAVLCTLGDAFSAGAFAARPRARLLANFGVGFNHIDVVAARRAGLDVTNTPGAVTDATADMALTLMLMTCRRAAEGERLVRSGAWRGWAPMQLLGTHMSGKHLGVIGMGRIGQAIARRCHFGFGMKVSYFNRSPKALDFPACQMSDLHELLSEVDIVVIAVPGGPQTRHLINAAAFQAMRREGILINIARGDVIDEAALIDALQSGQIARAGLDVYENEPEVPQALRDMEQVTLLPHLGTNALEVRSAMGMMALDNVIAMAEGRPLPNPV